VAPVGGLEQPRQPPARPLLIITLTGIAGNTSGKDAGRRVPGGYVVITGSSGQPMKIYNQSCNLSSVMIILVSGLARLAEAPRAPGGEARGTVRKKVA
jgi:hypothetical protein